jgi:hypothetical protein
MRKISEITHNGKPLQEILNDHYKYLTTSTGGDPARALELLNYGNAVEEPRISDDEASF